MLIEIVLELVKNRLLRLFVALEILVVAQALNGLVLFLGERLRYEHAYVDNEIARATSVTLNGADEAFCLAVCQVQSLSLRWFRRW